MVSPATNGSAEHTNGHTNGAAPPKKKMILNAFVEMCKFTSPAAVTHPSSHFLHSSTSSPTHHPASIPIQSKRRKQVKKKKPPPNTHNPPGSGHQSPGLWRHPSDQSTNFNSIQHWTTLAQTLEAGGFHAMFIADVLGGYDVYKKSLDEAVRSGAQWPVNEPLQVVPAMAAATRSIGFGVTVSTTYEQPYHLARRLSTLDHLTGGRCGWNVVTGYLDSAARNLGRAAQPEHDERYAIAEEYMEVMYKLWQASWREDAVALDRARGIYTHPDRVRQINHEGKYFTVPGPHICQPSPQRVPVIMQAGTSKAGTAFSSKHAEAVFVSGHSPASCARGVASIREQAAKAGRDPKAIKVIAKVCIVLGRTLEEAEAKYADYAQYGDIGGALALFGGWTGYDMDEYGDDEELRLVQTNAIRSYMEGLGKHQPKVGKWTKRVLGEHLIVGGLGGTIVGTPEVVADELERWMREADVDGFNIVSLLKPSFPSLMLCIHSLT